MRLESFAAQAARLHVKARESAATGNRERAGRELAEAERLAAEGEKRLEEALDGLRSLRSALTYSRGALEAGAPL